MPAHRPAIHTPVFDGPLELLLYLVRREGVDVHEIPIARITREYLGFLARMERIDIDVAGDFVVMAATLCELKSRGLLPVPRLDEDDEDDPRAELAARLIDYERFRLAGEALLRLPLLDRDEFARPPAEAPAGELDAGVDALGLAACFYGLLDRQRRPEPVHRVSRDTVSYAQQHAWVVGRLEVLGRCTMSELLAGLPGRAERIVSFVVLLDLARHCCVDLVQAEHLGPITIVPTGLAGAWPDAVEAWGG